MSTQAKINISRPEAYKNVNPIVGILQEVNSSRIERQQGKKVKIALIIHGVCSFKDQIYHRRLANEFSDSLNLSSFRYDLVNQGGESYGANAAADKEGESSDWKMGGHDEDADDLGIVVDHLEKLGFEIYLIAAHSRGSIFTSYFLSTRAHRPIPYFVSISGRYKMDNISSERMQTYEAAIKSQGYFDWVVRVAGKQITRRVTDLGIKEFTQFDNSYLQSQFPLFTDVLIIHASDDMLVPVEDARTYHQIFSKRSTASSTLAVIDPKKGEVLGHNWLRPFDEPVNTVISWLKEKEIRNLKLKL